MARSKERGLQELYSHDPERAERLLVDRRRFLRVTGSLSAALFLAEPSVFAGRRPRGLAPAALAQTDEPFVIEGKDGLVILNDRPVNAETPVTLLDDDVTPNHRHYVRNNGDLSERAGAGNLSGWTLTIDGEVERTLKLDLRELQTRFTPRTAQLVLECAGNGRGGFWPPASGIPWKLGAVGCALYTGVRLKDVLEAAGVRPSAVFVAYYGDDVHLSGDPKEVPISRGVSIGKAMDEHTLLVWEMNGVPLPAHHGFPLRLVAPGWTASASGKWLTRLWVRDRVHDGPRMGGSSYRVPRHPVAPGTDVPDEDMQILEAMPVKSILTRPATGIEHPAGAPLALRGHAWCGDGPVASMHVSRDFGATWVEARLAPPRNPFSWQRWNAEVSFPLSGHYEVWARATDHRGRQQPMVVPGWNPGGYANNAMQRIAVRVV